MTQAAARAQRRARRAPRQSGRWARWLPRISAGLGIAGALFWWALHRYDWMGPLVANSLRAVVGVDAVAHLEDFVYGVEDRYNRLAHPHEAPKAYWAVPPSAAPAPPPLAAVAPSASAA